MAIEVSKSYVITDDVSGERISLQILGNGNIKLDMNCTEI